MQKWRHSTIATAATAVNREATATTNEWERERERVSESNKFKQYHNSRSHSIIYAYLRCVKKNGKSGIAENNDNHNSQSAARSLYFHSHSLPLSHSFVECAQLVGTHVNCDIKPFYLPYISFPFISFCPFALWTSSGSLIQFSCCAFGFALQTAAQKKTCQKCAK